MNAPNATDLYTYKAKMVNFMLRTFYYNLKHTHKRWTSAPVRGWLGGSHQGRAWGHEPGGAVLSPPK